MPGLLPTGGAAGSGILPSPFMQPITPNSQSNQNQAALLKPEELFCIVKGVLDDELCESIKAIYEFHIMNKIETKIWTINLKNPPGCVISGPAQYPADVEFELSDTDFQKMFYGQLSPTDAYMNDSLVVHGSLQIAMRLEILFKKMKN